MILMKTMLTSGQSNSTKRPDRSRTLTVESYLRGCASVHPSNTCFLGFEPTRVHIPNDISIGSAVFAQPTADSRYALQRAALFPVKIAASHRGSGPASNTWFLGFTPVRISNDMSIGSAVFAGLTIVTNQQTDRSVGNNRPHVLK